MTLHDVSVVLHTLHHVTFDAVGRHTVEITHLGVAIMGSPFFVEIYDPSKIRVEGNRTGMVGKRMEFDGKTLEVE